MVCGTKAANNGFKRTECAGMVQNEQYFHMISVFLGASCSKRARVAQTRQPKLKGASSGKPRKDLLLKF
jgi:hypothetical protein